MSRMWFTEICFATLFIMTALAMTSPSQQTPMLRYTILKLHTFKTATENCKNDFKDAGRYKERKNESLEFGLTPNCSSNCLNLSVQEHLIRIHKVVANFVEAMESANNFESRQQDIKIRSCVYSVYHELNTLQRLTARQIPAANASRHTSTSTSVLKLKTKKFLESLPESAGKQLNNDDVMKEFSITLMRELFVAAVVLQKDRIEMNNLVNGNQVI